MGIRQKFYVLAGIVGALLAVISIIGFYTADKNLEEAVQAEFSASMDAAENEVDGWLAKKGASAQYAADLMTEFNGDESRIKSIASLALGSSDPEILDLNIGAEDGYFASYRTQNKSTGTLDPRTRPWYNDAKKAGKLVFTDPYMDKNTGKFVVSAVAPFKKDGQYFGTLCTDIDLAVVDAMAKKIKYHGEAGKAFIADKNGIILGNGGEEKVGSKAQDLPGVGSRFEEMLKTDHGSFLADAPDGKAVIAYTTVGSTGWLIVSEQLGNIEHAKGSVDGVYHDIANMSAKAKHITTASQQTAEAAKKGADLMEEAIKKMGTIEESVLASSEVVKTLGENSQQIGQIVEAISSIAEQTNLLSLNAAIEAARAGEQGRGFAVVADEVRKLAAESQESAEQIKERIASIQNDTAKAVESMKNGTQEVTLGTKAIRDVGEQFEDIMSKVDSINTQMEEINSAVSQVSTGAEQIVTAVDAIDNASNKTSDSMQSISSATEEQSASNEEIAAASQALATLAIKMQEAVGKFKV